MGHLSFGLHSELRIITIRTFQNTNALDLREREGFNASGPNQPERANAVPIREGEAPPIALQLPARRFVLHRTVVTLKAWVAFLARLLLLAVLVEAGNRLPGSICGGLTRHRVEASCEGEVFSKLRAERLKLIRTHTSRIHPEPKCFVADELHRANGVIDRGLLGLVGSEFVLQNQHECLASWPLHGSGFRAWRSARY